MAYCRAGERRRHHPERKGNTGAPASRVSTSFPSPAAATLVYVAQQRGWNYTTSPVVRHPRRRSRRPGAVEPSGLESGSSIPGAPPGEPWSYFEWQLEPKPVNAAWVGLSGSPGPDGWILIHRDNLTGDFGVFKKLARLPIPVPPARSPAERRPSTACAPADPNRARSPTSPKASRSSRGAGCSWSPTTTASTAGQGRRGSSALGRYWALFD